MSPGLAQGRDAGDHDAGSDRGPIVVHAHGPETADQFHDAMGVFQRQVRLGGRDLRFRLAVVMSQLDGDHAVHQGVLRLMDSGVLLGVAGEDGVEVRVDLQIAVAATAGGQFQQAFFQDSQQDVIGFGPRAVELVVDQGQAEFTGRSDAIVHPDLGDILLGLDHRVNEVVHHPRGPIAHLPADQVGAAELVVAVDQDYRTPQLGGHVHCQRGFAGARRPAEMHRITGLRVKDRPLGQAADVGRVHKIRLAPQ